MANLKPTLADLSAQHLPIAFSLLHSRAAAFRTSSPPATVLQGSRSGIGMRRCFRSRSGRQICGKHWRRRLERRLRNGLRSP